LGVLAALALVMGGAAGDTKVAFQQVLLGPTPNLERAEITFADWLRQLLNLDKAPEEDEEAQEAQEAPEAALKLATSLWADEYLALTPAFLQHAHAWYNAEAATLDFASPAAAPTINAWVQRHTRRRIDSIVSAETLANLLPPALVLLNAVYFRATWGCPFDPDGTRPAPFRRADGTTQEVPFMHQVSENIGYTAGDGWQAVALPYLGFDRSFSMLVVLPDESAGLPALLAGLDAERWASLQQAISSQGIEVELALPKFRLEYSTDLVPALRQLGLANALAPGADFSVLGYEREHGGGFIQSVLHKAFVEVNEQGTEAAAATVIMAAGGCAYEPQLPRQIVVKIDSPFLYVIADNQDGAILFAGTVNELPE
jgi:serpin B